MSFVQLESLDQIPTEGKAVIIVLVDSRAPCKKLLNNANAASSIIESNANPPNAFYGYFNFCDVIKESLNVHRMPLHIVYVDGESKKRFTGHFYSHFELATMYGEGFNK